MDDQEIEIVHPQELRRCGSNEVGEIWVKGQSVSPGYWNRAEETVHAFEARFDGSVGNYLRTGDLGFLRQGELFVTGRLKDLIIIRGRNHYPQDIERTAEESYPTTLRKGCVAAFSIEAAGQERLALAVEVHQQSGFDAHELSAAIREAVADLHGLQVYTIAFLQPGALPKTSSGKLQRQAIRSGFLDRTLQEIGREELKLQSIPAPGRASQRPSAAPTSKDSTEGMLELHGPVRLDEGRN